MTAPVTTVSIDTSGTAFGATPTYSNHTADVMEKGRVRIDYGGADEVGIRPSTCTFALANDDGRWTPGHASAPAGWTLGAPVQVKVTRGGTDYPRFTGLVASIEPTWPGGVQSWSVVQVTAVDVSSRLGASLPLRSMVELEVLADSPIAFYPLNDIAGSRGAANISTTAQPQSYISSSNGVDPAASYSFGAGPEQGLFLQSSPSGALTFEPEIGSGVNPTGYNLFTAGSRRGPLLGISGGFGIECWLNLTAGTGGIFYQVDSLNRDQIDLFSTSDGVVWFRVYDDDGASFSLVSSASNLADGQWHHVVANLATDLKTLELYIDGDAQNANRVTNGVALTWGTPQGNGWGYGVAGYMNGSLTNLAHYQAPLSSARTLVHYQMGAGTLTESTDARFTRVAAYGGITPGALPTGFGEVAGQVTAGRTALDVLQEVARTEGTYAYVNRSGELTFQARDHRYSPTAAVTLDGADVNPDITVRMDGQGWINEITVNRVGGTAQRVFDAASQAQYGVRDGGTLDVASSTDEDAYNAGMWQLLNNAEPHMMIPSVTVNLRRLDTDPPVQAVLAADLGDLLSLTGLASQFPDTTPSLFIEGTTEIISQTEWWVSFFTSAVNYEDDVLVLDHPTYGALDVYALGF